VNLETRLRNERVYDPAVATVEDITRAAERLDTEVPAQEQGEFDTAVAHAVNLAQETDPEVRTRLEHDYGELSPLQRKWYDRLTEALGDA
jgi:hypothetical protein